MGKNPIDEVLKIFGNEYNKQVILYGPPGTSKTYSSILIAANFLDTVKEENYSKSSMEKAEKFLEKKKEEGTFKVVQFHPSYNYEDFIRGIEIEMIDKIGENGQGKQPNYKVKDKLFADIAHEAYINYRRAMEDDKKPENYVLLIDEINRAPLASVLGELIYGLEYRGDAIDIPYEVEYDDQWEDGSLVKEDESEEQKQGKTKLKTNKVIVPPNLYIIGTMNTADRSIGCIDYAVRRRFAFVSLPSDIDVIENVWEDIRKELKDSVVKLYNKLEELVKDSFVDETSGYEDIMLGHTYFLGDKKKCEGRESAIEYMQYKIEYQIIPIINEYFKDGILDIKNVKDEGVVELNKALKAFNLNVKCKGKALVIEENDSI